MRLFELIDRWISVPAVFWTTVILQIVGMVVLYAGKGSAASLIVGLVCMLPFWLCSTLFSLAFTGFLAVFAFVIVSEMREKSNDRKRSVFPQH